MFTGERNTTHSHLHKMLLLNANMQQLDKSRSFDEIVLLMRWAPNKLQFQIAYTFSRVMCQRTRE